jgi:hypothetical protein
MIVLAGWKNWVGARRKAGPFGGGYSRGIDPAQSGYKEFFI